MGKQGLQSRCFSETMDKIMIQKGTYIRPAVIEDLKFVASIHKQQFSTHYLGQFSTILLERFYESLLRDEIIFVVSETEGQVSGFVVGGKLSEINKYTSQFIKNNIPLYVSEILIHPQTWINSCKKFARIIFKCTPPACSLDNTMDYTLLSIAVSPCVQGKHIANHLVEGFEHVLKKYSDEYFLSVKDNNFRALRFYQKMGLIEKVRFNKEIQLTKQI